MMKKVCVLGAIVVVLVSSGCVSMVEREDEFFVIGKVRITDFVDDATVNDDGELNVNPTDNLDTNTSDFAGAQTDTIFLTPIADKRLEIHQIFASTDSKVVDILMEFENSGIVVFKLYTSNFQAGASQVLHLRGAVNESLNITCGAGTFVSVTFHEVD